MSEIDWSDYESGPFCRHWGDPSDCEMECEACGHHCSRHRYGDDESGCMVEGCDCKKWNGPTPGAAETQEAGQK